MKKKYFGPEGELFKKRESLMAPIQDEIYNAVKDISDSKGYSLILDRASDTGIIFASPKIDISNEVLTKLGIFQLTFVHLQAIKKNNNIKNRDIR